MKLILVCAVIATVVAQQEMVQVNDIARNMYQEPQSYLNNYVPPAVYVQPPGLPP
ncbi:hypothetical protein BIW11_08747, partial [Tropilaelaps mercedesae]